MAKRVTVVVNLFAGPGAGKTTTAMEISAELKKRGINLEYVQEYAKELVYAERFDLLKDQEHVTDTQYQRLDVLRNKVDVIITDSPVLLGLVYGKGRISEDYQRKIRGYHDSFDNFNLFIERGKDYQQSGRLESREEAVQKDNEIVQMLKENNVFYGTYRHDTVDKLMDNIQSHIEKLRNEPPTKPKENYMPNEKTKKPSWKKIVVPTDWRQKEYDKISFYRIGREGGELDGYVFSQAKAMINTDDVVTVRYGNPAKEEKVICDRIIVRADSTITLKKGTEQKKITGKELASLLSRCLETNIQRKRSGSAESKADTQKSKEKATERKFEPLENISSEMRDTLTGTFQEDIYSYEGKQVFLSDVSGKYIVADNDDIEFTDEGELVLKKRAQGEKAYRAEQGEKVIFESESDAIISLIGGSSRTYDMMSDEDKNNVDAAYAALMRETDREYYDSLPSKEVFSKEYLIKKNWAKYQNYKNDKAYEKNTPYPLRDKQIFVCWKFVYYNENGEPYVKPQKVPFSPHYDGRAKSGSRDGSHVKTWGTFDEACKAVDKFGYDGVGIMFGNGVMGVDIDGCIKDGKITDEAKDIITRLNSYTEYSPSGTGVHTLCFGSIPKGSRNDSIGLEMYPSGRFFTLTGHRYENYARMAKKADTQPVLDEIYNENFAGREIPQKITSFVGENEEESFTSKEIVDKLLSAPKMSGKFKRICQGLPPYVWDAAKEKWTDKLDSNFLKVDGTPDTSKLDYAFCKMLVFYRATSSQIDEIYRAQDTKNAVEGLTVEGGGLARDKWDRQQGSATYGEYVIKNAFRGVTALYDENTAKDYARGFAERKKTNVNEME